MYFSNISKTHWSYLKAKQKKKGGEGGNKGGEEGYTNGTEKQHK